MRVLLNRKTFSAEFVTIFRFLVFKMCDFLFLFPENVIFASKMKKETLPNNTTLYEVEQNGFMAGRNSRFEHLNEDYVLPYIVFSLCTNGSSRTLYDMQEVVQQKNDLGFLMPGHLVRELECSDDFTYTWFIISPKMINEVLSEEDISRFGRMPMCRLTDEQTNRLMAVVDQLMYISSLSEEKMPQRHSMLKSELTVGYELLLHFREVQDPEWNKSTKDLLYSRFCDLVVENYTKSRNVNFYADLLGYDARYFSKLFRTMSNGISPLEWIEQYVATQAKFVIKANPKQSIKETAFQLGFPSTANFCRYFKRVTGITPQEYRKMNL